MKFVSFVACVVFCSSVYAAEPIYHDLRMTAEYDANMCETYAEYVYRDRIDNISGREYAESLGSCTGKVSRTLVEQYQALPNTNPALNDAAKKLYMSWLAYSSILKKGLSPAEIRRSGEAVAFNQALANYKGELTLAK